MKKVLKIIICLVLCVSILGLIACGKKTTYGQFGEFSYNGKTLTEYAVKTITAEEAKNILNNSNINNAYCINNKANGTIVYNVDLLSVNNETTNFTPPEDMINRLLESYAGCTVTTKYYIDGSEDIQTKIDTITGVDFKNVLIDNRFTPFNQLIAKNILVFDDLIDYMEEENEEFKNSAIGLVAPFKTIFSYHTDIDGNLIVQNRDYAEIASSIGGGIGATYRQDTEIIYDADGKMTLWQTSLGLASSTPDGTMKQGYILEMHIDWTEKV